MSDLNTNGMNNKSVTTDGSKSVTTKVEDLSEQGKYVKELIKKTRGRFFKCIFRKQNGELRTMLARTECKKGVKGTGLPNMKENIVKVYDVQNGWRSINVESVLSLKCGKINYESK